jgi:DNA-binding CsgD family transcriptional regulator
LNRFLKQCQMEYLLPGPGEDMNALDTIFSEHKISEREKEIIHLLLKGKSNREIEDELFISVHTVRNHIYKIYQKLGVKNRVELVNFIHNSLHL